EVMPICPRYSRRPARGGPGRAKVPDALPGQPWSPMREQPRHDQLLAPLEISHSLELLAQERVELRGQIDQPPVVVLCHAGIEPQGPGLEIEMPALEREHLALHAPPERVRDRDCDLQIRLEVPAHGLVLRPLEEPTARCRLLRLVKERQPRELAVLVGEP